MYSRKGNTHLKGVEGGDADFIRVEWALNMAGNHL